MLHFGGKRFPVTAVECIEMTSSGEDDTLDVRVLLTTVRGRTFSEKVADQAAADARVAELLQQAGTTA